MSEKLKIVSERFLLRELTEDDATERYLMWFDDFAAKKYIDAATKTKSLLDLKQYVCDRIGRNDILFFGIFDKSTGLHIGNIKYEPVNSERGYAIMGVLIGDTAYRGKGVTSEVLKASAQWLKNHRNIRHILLGASIDNAAAIRAYEKVGFEISETEYIKRKPNAISMILDLNKLDDLSTKSSHIPPKSDYIG